MHMWKHLITTFNEPPGPSNDLLVNCHMVKTRVHLHAGGAGGVVEPLPTSDEPIPDSDDPQKSSSENHIGVTPYHLMNIIGIKWHISMHEGCTTQKR